MAPCETRVGWDVVSIVHAVVQWSLAHLTWKDIVMGSRGLGPSATEESDLIPCVAYSGWKKRTWSLCEVEKGGSVVDRRDLGDRVHVKLVGTGCHIGGNWWFMYYHSVGRYVKYYLFPLGQGPARRLF